MPLDPAASLRELPAIAAVRREHVQLWHRNGQAVHVEQVSLGVVDDVEQTLGPLGVDLLERDPPLRLELPALVDEDGVEPPPLSRIKR
jgi:hypothetical protein